MSMLDQSSGRAAASPCREIRAPMVWPRFRLPPTHLLKQVLSECPGEETTPRPSAAGVVQEGEVFSRDRPVTPGSLHENAEHRAKWKSPIASLTPRP
ncbi:UNVERIFIED_CONTAM: hypothetical protein PYX00_006921 [Menopon gallinae]|uniref:Uncharacterized protein n=1 Tax=Menopon gallinae TaxID=328185 RepID=A0AAW2HH16_9NEOP